MFPQFSSFPSTFPPQGDQFGQIIFDSTQYTRYQEIVGQHLNETRLKKRNPTEGDTPIPPPLGIAMPCQVQNFKVSYVANKLTKKFMLKKIFLIVAAFKKLYFRAFSVMTNIVATIG